MLRYAERLMGLHPDLKKVVEKAAEKISLHVLEGVRSTAACYENYGKGRTEAQCKKAGVPAGYANPKAAKVTWLTNPLNSKHRAQKDGYGHAVDLGPVPMQWEDLKAFDAIAVEMFAAAKELGVKIRWGADWDADGKKRERGESDSPHFELVG